MTRPVIAGRDRGVFHLGGANKADFSVIRIVRSSGNLPGAYRRSRGGLRIVASTVSVLLFVASTRVLASTTTRPASSVCAVPGVLMGVCTAGGGSPSTASAATTTALA